MNNIKDQECEAISYQFVVEGNVDINERYRTVTTAHCVIVFYKWAVVSLFVPQQQ